MKKLMIILLLMIISFACFASGFEFDVGPRYEYTCNIEAKYSTCAAYGVEVNASYSVFYADLSVMYVHSSYSPMKMRASLGLAFDFWGMRTTISAGNEYSLIKNGNSYSLFCGGLSDTAFWDAPMSLSFGIYKLFKNISFGASAHFATPLILSKNNLPDIFTVMRDRKLLLYYLESSSIAVTVQWRFL